MTNTAASHCKAERRTTCITRSRAIPLGLSTILGNHAHGNFPQQGGVAVRHVEDAQQRENLILKCHRDGAAILTETLDRH